MLCYQFCQKPQKLQVGHLSCVKIKINPHQLKALRLRILFLNCNFISSILCIEVKVRLLGNEDTILIQDHNQPLSCLASQCRGRCSVQYLVTSLASHFGPGFDTWHAVFVMFGCGTSRVCYEAIPASDNTNVTLRLWSDLATLVPITVS